MDWMDHNLDAYRDVAEILTTLRATARRQLEGAFGRDWHRDGVPPQVLERMIARKERERAIDWHESEYQEIINYSSFADVLEIIEDLPELFTEIMQLAPSPALLHTRFLELDVISQKIAMARPISENELGFLGTFHIRFRKAVEALRSRPIPDVTPRPRKAPAPEPPQEPSAQAASTAEEPDTEAPAGETTATADSGPAKEAAAPQPKAAAEAAPATAAPAEPPGPPRPPMRRATGAGGSPATAAASADDDAEASKGNGRDHEASPDETDTAPTEAAPPVNVLDQALERSDHTTILRELYREVTNIAEGIWTSDTVPPAMVWPKVVGSPWYEINFSKIGLKPLSDFYEVREQAEERAQAGASKNELQEFLKECNFAKTLLAMRDMFQKHHI